MPERYGRYFEPFAGGAALFFALAPHRAVLSDANADLMAMYAAVAHAPEAVIRLLATYEREHSETLFYGTRTLFNERGLTPVQRAAALIYLNRVCFNGLWRVNADGKFNVPIGRYENPTICNEPAIRAAAAVLSRAELRSGDYEAVLHDVEPGDFVYFDPPYDEMFASYTANAFGKDAQRRLATVAREIVDRGVHVMLSNSDTPFVREIYDGFEIEAVKCQHAISADGDGRGAVAELVITGGQSRSRSKSMSRQTEIPGAEDPNIDADIESAIYAYLDKGVAHRRAGEEKKGAHYSMVQRMVEKGRDSHPYTDPKTGKRKLMWITREPKAKSSSPPGSCASRPKKERRGGPRRDEDAVLPDVAADKNADKVESRRVPRKSVEKDVDPFGATRAAMTDMATEPEPFNPPKAKPTQKRGKNKRGR